MTKKDIIKALRNMAVEPVYDPDWNGITGTFNIANLADFIFKEASSK